MHRDASEDKDQVVDHEARRIAERAELKADNVGSRLDRIDDDIKEGFSKANEATRRVHGRIDWLLRGILAVLATVILQSVLTKIGLL